jgi:hypothetical protein
MGNQITGVKVDYMRKKDDTHIFFAFLALNERLERFLFRARADIEQGDPMSW